MAPLSVQPRLRDVLAVAGPQHRVIRTDQLGALGLTKEGIRHRVARGRLFRLYPEVYAVGAPYLSSKGEWIAAVFACGGGALLSHRAAGALWRLVPWRGGPIDVSVPARRSPRARAVRIHRRRRMDAAVLDEIPVTTVVQTIVDLATELEDGELHRAIRESDRLDLLDPEGLRVALGHLNGRYEAQSCRIIRLRVRN